ncbi:MAG: hypothetical protein JSU95_10235 [Betaproteobacteria bacterium]|nr:MAG: hypothetical protein JSU95_10235 [Betaproteobacteria bacterium]
MKLIKTTIAAALFGLSLNAFAAVSDLSYVTHGSQSGQDLKVGQITEPRWSDRNAVNKDARSEAKPFAKAAGDYRFGDINSVTHN